MSPEEIRSNLIGPIPSIRTPFNKDSSIDFDGLRNMIDFDIAAGAKTIMLTAGDSHYDCLSDAEISELTKVTAEHTAGRAMVIAADCRYDTRQAIEFAKFTKETGADLLMIMPPDWAGSCTPETFAEHYIAIAEIMPVMIVTNLYGARGIDCFMKMLEIILKQDTGVIAIKDDVCGTFIRKMSLLAYGRMAIVSGGSKAWHLNNHCYGCDGYLSTFITFNPQITRDYWAAIEAGDLIKTKEIIRDYDMPLWEITDAMQGGFDAGMHGILEICGLAKRWRRKPYYSLNDEELEKLEHDLRAKSILI